MAPIRKGDGTGLGAKGFSQVRKGDGTVLWNAIPDSGNLHAHYDLTEQLENDGNTIDPLVDQSDNGHDAPAVGSPTMDVNGFNDNPTAVLDGGDGWDVVPSDWDTLTQPYTIYIVMALDANENDDQRLFFEDRGDNRVHAMWNDAGNWNMWANGTGLEGSNDTGVNLLSMLYNGSGSVWEENGSQTASGDAGTDDLSGFPIGHRDDGSKNDFWYGRMSEIAVYNNEHDSETREDFWTYARSKWSI